MSGRKGKEGDMMFGCSDVQNLISRGRRHYRRLRYEKNERKSHTFFSHISLYTNYQKLLETTKWGGDWSVSLNFLRLTERRIERSMDRLIQWLNDSFWPVGASSKTLKQEFSKKVASTAACSLHTSSSLPRWWWWAVSLQHKFLELDPKSWWGNNEHRIFSCLASGWQLAAGAEADWYRPWCRQQRAHKHMGVQTHREARTSNINQPRKKIIFSLAKEYFCSEFLRDIRRNGDDADDDNDKDHHDNVKKRRRWWWWQCWWK